MKPSLLTLLKSSHEESALNRYGENTTLDLDAQWLRFLIKYGPYKLTADELEFSSYLT